MSNIIRSWLSTALLAISLMVIVLAILRLGVSIGLVIAAIPIFVLVMMAVLKKPFYGYVILFLLNYFIIVLIRYLDIGGLSIVTDIFIVFVFVSVMLNAMFSETGHKVAKMNKGLILVGFIWFLFCVLELLNPSAMTEVWLYNRSVTLYLLIIPLLSTLVVTDYRNLNTLVMILSVLTLMGFAKGLMQKYIGFDSVEQAFLNSGGYKTHLLISGTRYFSFYVSAGIFGAVMGHAVVVFGIIAIYTQDVVKRWYFVIVAVTALFGLLISGTRGAVAVPVAGFVLFIILSKKVKIMIPTFILLTIGYLFLAMTTIGQNNELIRRMRTLFDPDEPSLVVRRENQKLFAEYLADRPFGEGIGLSGIDAQPITERFTTSIATDSWYVKIWVETGIVGLVLYVAIFLYIMIYGSYIVLCRIRDPQLRGLLTALLCGVFGILAASYGNQVLGQYPVALIVYMSIAFVFMGPYFDKQIIKK